MKDYTHVETATNVAYSTAGKADRAVRRIEKVYGVVAANRAPFKDMAAATNVTAEAAELAALAAFKSSYDLDPDDIWAHPEVWNMHQSALHACKMARESAAKARYAAERAALYAS